VERSAGSRSSTRPSVHFPAGSCRASTAGWDKGSQTIPDRKTGIRELRGSARAIRGASVHIVRVIAQPFQLGHGDQCQLVITIVLCHQL